MAQFEFTYSPHPLPPYLIDFIAIVKGFPSIKSQMLCVEKGGLSALIEQWFSNVRIIWRFIKT